MVSERAALEAEEAQLPVVGHFEGHLEPESIDVKILCNADVVAGKRWNGSLHLRSLR